MSAPQHRVRFADSARMFAWMRAHDLMRRLPLDAMALVEAGSGRSGRARELLLPALDPMQAEVLNDLQRFDATAESVDSKAPPKAIPLSTLWQRVAPSRATLGGGQLDAIYVLLRRGGSLSSDEVLGRLAASGAAELALQVYQTPDGELIDAFRVRATGARDVLRIAEVGRSSVRYWTPDADRPAFLVPLGFDLPLLRAHPELYETAVGGDSPSVVCWTAEAQSNQGWGASRLQPLFEDWTPIAGHLDLGSLLWEPSGVAPTEPPSELVTPRFSLRFWPVRRREQPVSRILLRFRGHGGNVGERMLDWLDQVDAGLDTATWFFHHPVAEDAGPFGQVDHYLLVDSYSGRPRPMGLGTTLFVEHPWLSQYGLPVFVEHGYALRPDPGPGLFGADSDPQGFVAALRRALLASAGEDSSPVEAIVLASDTIDDPDSPVSVVLKRGRPLSAAGQDLLTSFHPIVQIGAARAVAQALDGQAERAHDGVLRIAEQQAIHVQRQVAEILATVQAQLEGMDAEWRALDASMRSAGGFHHAVRKQLASVGESWTKFVETIVRLHLDAAQKHRSWHEGFDAAAAALQGLLDQTKVLQQKAGERVAAVASSSSQRLQDLQQELLRVEAAAKQAESNAAKVDSLDRAIATALETGRAAIEHEEKRLQSARADAEQRMSEQEARRRVLDEAREAVVKREAEVASATKSNDGLEAEVTARRHAAEAELKRQQARTAQLEALQQTVIPGLEAKVQVERSKVAALEAKGLEARHVELSAALRAAQDDLTRLRDEEASLRVAEADLKKAKQQAASILPEIGRLKKLRDGPLLQEKAKLKQARAELGQLREQQIEEGLEASRAESERVKIAIKDLQAKIGELRTEKSALDRDLDQLEKAQKQQQNLLAEIRKLRASTGPAAWAEVLQKAEHNLRLARQANPKPGFGARILRLIRRQA